MRHILIILFNPSTTYKELLFTLFYRPGQFSSDKFMPLSRVAKNTVSAV